MTTEAEKRAKKKWKEKYCKGVYFLLDKRKDADIIQALEKAKNKHELFRKAIRRIESEV